MHILTTPNWTYYELRDSGNGNRLERFGKYILVRPDPQAIWHPKLRQDQWQNADAVFERTKQDEGKWIRHVMTQNVASLPHKWMMQYKNLSFWIKLTPFKHTGVFPEQAVQWDFITDVVVKHLAHRNGFPTGKKPSAISTNHSETFDNNNQTTSTKYVLDDVTKRHEAGYKPAPAPANVQKHNNDVHILNLFAYTGVASLAAAAAGAKVTHVDASKPAISWARENQEASQLTDRPIRWIVDDAIKFCQREVKRGVTYDGIIMDPPIYGHGPKGETWKFVEDFPQLLQICKQLLSNNPLFVIVNAYAISASALMLKNVMEDYFADLGGTIDCGELTLKENSGRLLSTGIFGRWAK